MPLDNPAVRIAWQIRDIHHRHMLHVHNVIGRYGPHPGQPRILHTVARPGKIQALISRSRLARDSRL